MEYAQKVGSIIDEAESRRDENFRQHQLQMTRTKVRCYR